MAKPSGPGESDDSRPENRAENNIRDDELERRRRELGARIATRREADGDGEKSAGSSGNAGYGQAIKLSSEFIAGIAVGIGLGWFVDRLAGTSPLGLIVFLLLGFGAGVLNVLRSAGLISEAGTKSPEGRPDDPEKK